MFIRIFLNTLKRNYMKIAVFKLLLGVFRGICPELHVTACRVGCEERGWSLFFLRDEDFKRRVLMRIETEVAGGWR
jgi:hypothetical protein